MKKEYWKITALKNLIKIEVENKIKATITRDYINDMKLKMKLMQDAYEQGFKDAKEKK